MADVKKVPDGYHTATPFLNIKGAADAIEFYKKALGAEERDRMTGPDGKIMHAEIQIGNSIIMIGEAVMQAPTQSSIFLYVDDVDALWKRATAAGAEITMPLADQFWGDRYGVLKDAWGNRWPMATHKEDVTPDEMKRRGAEAMKAMAAK